MAPESVETLASTRASQHPDGSELLSRKALDGERMTAVSISLLGFAFYASIYFVKTSMFAATWRDRDDAGRSYKAALAMAQTMGYLLGKVPTLVITPKLPRHLLQAAMLFTLWGSGLLTAAVAIVPPVAGVGCVLCASMCLAPVWSVLLRFFEGRTYTEAIVAVISLSWIGFGGVAKSAGASMLRAGFSEQAMVACCASIGLVVGTGAAVGLSLQPAPSIADVARRGERERLRSVRSQGAQLCARHGIGLLLSITAYVLIGSLRAYRDFYQAELFAAVGLEDRPEAFAESEVAISLVVLATIASFSSIVDNWKALITILGIIAAGGTLVVVCTLAWRVGAFDGFVWILGVGCGTFLAYMPLGCVLYDRLVGAAREEVTTSPLSVVSDAAVLLGTFALLSALDAGRRVAGPSTQDTASYDAAIADEFGTMACAVGGLVVVLIAAASVAFAVSVLRAKRRPVLAQSSPPSITEDALLQAAGRAPWHARKADGEGGHFVQLADLAPRSACAAEATQAVPVPTESVPPPPPRHKHGQTVGPAECTSTRRETSAPRGGRRIRRASFPPFAGRPGESPTACG